MVGAFRFRIPVELVRGGMAFGEAKGWGERLDVEDMVPRNGGLGPSY